MEYVNWIKQIMIAISEHYSTAVSLVGLPSLLLVNRSAGATWAFPRKAVEDEQQNGSCKNLDTDIYWREMWTSSTITNGCVRIYSKLCLVSLPRLRISQCLHLWQILLMSDS